MKVLRQTLAVLLTIAVCSASVFSRAAPKLAVYTHLTLLARPGVKALRTDELVAQTRETYQGPLVVGEDLMAFDIGDTGVKIVPAGAKR